MKHKLSVTIPSYRQPEALTRALRALEAQTFKDFDVIIIDDMSGTPLQSIIERFSKTLDIRLVENEYNLGAMKNMQKSIFFPTDSEYVFSHHEDDYIKADYLERAVSLLDNHPKLSFVLSSATWVRSDEAFSGAMMDHSTHKTFTFHEFLKASLERVPFIFGSVVYRRAYLQGEFDLQTYHTLCDKIFLSELLQYNKSLCAYLPSPGIYVHDHTLDAKDLRSSGATLDHIINYFSYYKNHLPPSSSSNKLITNGALLAYSNLPGKKSFLEFLSKQRHVGLITLNNIDGIGIFSLLTLLLSHRTRAKLTRFVTRMVK